jgi:hypothetical protein
MASTFVVLIPYHVAGGKPIIDALFPNVIDQETHGISVSEFLFVLTKGALGGPVGILLVHA